MSGTVCQDGMADGLEFGDPETLESAISWASPPIPPLAGDPAV